MIKQLMIMIIMISSSFVFFCLLCIIPFLLYICNVMLYHNFNVLFEFVYLYTVKYILCLCSNFYYHYHYHYYLQILYSILFYFNRHSISKIPFSCSSCSSSSKLFLLLLLFLDFCPPF